MVDLRKYTVQVESFSSSYCDMYKQIQHVFNKYCLLIYLIIYYKITKKGYIWLLGL